MPSAKQRREKRAKKQAKQTDAAPAPSHGQSEAKATLATHQHDEMMRLHSKDISIRGLTIQFGPTTLLNNAYLHLTPGKRYALQGINGCGKSTLLKHMEDRTILGFPKSIETIMVRQTETGSDLSALEIVAQALSGESGQLREQILALEAQQVDGRFSVEQGEEYARLVDALATRAESGATGKAEAERVLKEMGFKKKMREQPSKELSGGWKMRISLACAIIRKPDMLLLDEPTNHLDLPGIRWLEQFLCSELCAEQTIVFVSHDRTFVDAVATDVILFANQKLQYFPGNYTAFEEAREQLLAQASRKADVDAKKKASLEAQLQRARKQAGSSKRGGASAGKAVRAVQTKLERVGQFQNVRDLDQTWRTADREFWAWGEAASITWQVDALALTERTNLRIAFSDPGSPGVSRSLLTLSNVAFHYPSCKDLFQNVDMSLDMTSRIAIVGANGQGKTTLVRVLSGDLTPTKGERCVVGSARIAYFGQHATDHFDLTHCALAEMAGEFPEAKDDELRKQLGSMGLGGRLALAPMAELSGGQRARVALAILAFRQPHMILLDEPTQHLDYMSIEALLEGLAAFPGGVVVVSHDRFFIETIRPQEVWLAHNGSIQRSDTW